MADRQENPYKGYHIVTSSSGGNAPPYSASFGIAKIMSDGTNGPTDSHRCDGAYQTEEEAHAAGNLAARQFIDLILEKM